jgi:hypothetical protein
MVLLSFIFGLVSFKTRPHHSGTQRKLPNLSDFPSAKHNIIILILLLSK